MKSVHPGRILRRELQAREMSANRLALALRLPSGRITDILNGKRGVSPDTALRLGRFFGNDPRFWLNLQTAYELARAERETGERIASEVAKLMQQGRPPILLVSPQIRPGLRQITQSSMPRLVVLSYNEITRDTKIEALGMIADVAAGK